MVSDIDLFEEPTNKKKENVTKLVKGLRKGIAPASKNKPLEAIPTGIKSIDEYVIGGVGGFPRGRFTEISGFESTGKSYFMYRQIGKVQQQGGSCALLDGEWSYENSWGEQFGIDNDKLLLCHYENAEDHYDQIFWLLKNKEPDMIVSDSVASLIPKEYMSIKQKNFKVATEICKINKMYLRMIFNGCKEYPGVKLPLTKTAMVFINHLLQSFGEYEQDDTGGGKALKFWAHLRLKLYPAGFGDIKDNMGNPIEQYVIIKTAKSRLAVPHRKAKIKLDWKGGISDVPSEVVFHVAVEKGLIDYKKSGGAITFNWKGNEIKLRGKMKFVEYCEQNEIYKKFVMEESSEQSTDEKNQTTVSGFNG